MNKTNVTIGIAIVALLVAGIAYFSPNAVTNTIERTVGGAAGPESTNDYQCYNGVCTHYRKQAMVVTAYNGTLGSTTVCALRSPTNATSTLKIGTAIINVSTSTAATLTVAKSATAYATTTLIRTQTVSANAKASLDFATTTLGIDSATGILRGDDVTFAPGQYLVLGASGAVGPRDGQGFQWTA